ncbi:lipopolysaccharide export system protein LptC [Cohaesibacter sp. ES.047]|uniref:LPS export ABC transporter periplasmic protein LptC n=1 Tax=Cohaesibacter sp. ES.047 TaxID=1798205 RepID=UPI000BB6D777|nr:LPS export ABC transporter periplasmic protein LptC [Cohaesibacter sp. ES.047]SNY91777.1 lipopolysaccharide export system protein LptC [Cohaesibacter sp. ES.047]
MQDKTGQNETDPFLYPPEQIASPGRSFHANRIISSTEQQRAFRKAQRHTQRVRLLKWGAPLLALGIIAGFVTWVAQQKPPPPPEDLAVQQEAFKQEELIMQNPKLNGFSQGRAYEVVAARAIQNVTQPDVINLEDISARITDDKQQWVTLTSTKGQFNQTSEHLELDGAVDVKSSLGYGLKTEAVEVEMTKGYMKTTAPVDIQSKDIKLSATTLEAIDNGEVFRFTGNVRLRIDAGMLNEPSTSRDQTADAPQEEANQ